MDPIDAIWEWYLTTREAMRIARKVSGNREQFPNLIEIKHRQFYEQKSETVASSLTTSEDWVEKLVALHMIATFERLLRQNIRDRIDSQFQPKSPDDFALRLECSIGSETWNFGESLVDLFRSVDANRRSQAKQLVKFRNWVAHGRYLELGEETPPINVTAVFARNTIREFLVQAGISH